jgi:hypothetical protein
MLTAASVRSVTSAASATGTYRANAWLWYCIFFDVTTTDAEPLLNAGAEFSQVKEYS